jgi:hypothetical protein
LKDYVTDKGRFTGEAVHDGVISGDSDPLILAFQGFYLKTFPARDQWGNYFYIYSGAEACAGNTFGIEYPTSQGDAEMGDDEFIVGSGGRDGTIDDVTYDPDNPTASLYEVGTMKDFEKEIANWNGSLVIGPRSAGAGTGT